MSSRIVSRVISIVCLGLVFVGGCRPAQRIQWAGGYLITLYSVPRTFRTGEMQIAVRIQDRDFRIVTDCASSLQVIETQSGNKESITLKSGPGKDMRGWVFFPRPATYDIIFSFSDAAGRTITAKFPIQIPPGKNKEYQD